MRFSRLGTIAVVAVSLAPASSCTPRMRVVTSPCVVDAGAGDCGRTVALRAGCRMQVALTPLISAGYIWRIASATPSMFDTSELPPRGDEPVAVGSQRQQVFEVVPLHAGEGQIVLRHERPFSPDDQPEICTIAVVVGPRLQTRRETPQDHIVGIAPLESVSMGMFNPRANLGRTACAIDQRWASPGITGVSSCSSW